MHTHSRLGHEPSLERNLRNRSARLEMTRATRAREARRKELGWLAAAQCACGRVTTSIWAESTSAKDRVRYCIQRVHLSTDADATERRFAFALRDCFASAPENRCVRRLLGSSAGILVQFMPTRAKLTCRFRAVCASLDCERIVQNQS